METRICSVPGCGKKFKTKGLCSMHAERVRRYGSLDPENMKRPDTRPAIERIMSRVEIVTESGCWIYTGPGETHGTINIKGRSGPAQVHRLMWEHHNGPIPKGLVVCHRCDVGFCCNPAHLFIGTQRDNQLDKVRKNRQARGETVASSILTREQVIDILQSKDTHAELALRYGVTKGAIKAVKTRQNWKHITGVPVYRRRFGVIL